MRFTSVLVAFALLALPARAQGPQTWSFDQSTTGNDIHFVSPTSVLPGAIGYESSFQIDLLEVTFTFIFFPVTVDVTDQIPPEVQSNSGHVNGPAPLALFDEDVIYPEPPDPPSIAAHIAMGLNALGKGTLDVTDVVLGTFVYQGIPVNLTKVRLKGSITVDETQWYDHGGALAGSNGAADLWGTGALTSGSPLAITLTNGVPGGTATLVVGIGYLGASFKGGVLGPTPNVIIPGLPLDPAGGLVILSAWPAGIPSGFSVYLQDWMADAGGPQGFSASNTISGTTP